MIYGDLRRFLTPAALLKDVITFRSPDMCVSTSLTMLAGQLTILRNNDWTRWVYREAREWMQHLDPRWVQHRATTRTRACTSALTLVSPSW